MKPKIMTPYTSRERERKYEVNNQPSLTIPDQTMSIAELVRRYAQGLPIEGQKVPLYDGENEFPDLTKMDLADRQTYLESAAQEYQEIQDRINKQIKAFKDKKEKPRIIEPDPVQSDKEAESAEAEE